MKCSITIAIATVAILPLAVVATAQELPRYDVERSCKNLASHGGSYSNLAYVGCMDIEQNSYENLKSRWASLPGSMRKECISLANYDGVGSYMTLIGCVDMETQAANDAATRKFKY